MAPLTLYTFSVSHRNQCLEFHYSRMYPWPRLEQCSPHLLLALVRGIQLDLNPAILQKVMPNGQRSFRANPGQTGALIALLTLQSLDPR